MNLEWLEDFVAVTQSGTFARASEVRNGSQPALSRRIKLLEEWVGVPLLERGQHRITLTAAGEKFLTVAQDVLGRVRVGRVAARELAEGAARSIQFASTHALALTFFPSWLRTLEEQKPIEATIKLIADNMVACEHTMLEGKAQFLLCHHHALADNRLNDCNFQSVQLSTDTLMPVSAPREAGSTIPLYVFPGTAEQPTPHLGYSDLSGMGRIIKAAAGEVAARAFLRPIFESHLATVLLSMARDRRGIAWLPASLIAEDLKCCRLVRAGGTEWDVPMEIHLFRSRGRQSAVAERLWSLVRKQSGH